MKRTPLSSSRFGTRLPEPTFAHLAEVTAQLRHLPLHIDERGEVTVSQLSGRARRLHQRHRLGLVVVDYLQLIASAHPRQNRYEHVTEVSGALKALAKELQVPVLALAQLNRATEQENRAPRLSDLRDSGSIEQDADAVLLLHQPTEESPRCDVRRVQLAVAKNRNGPWGTVTLDFEPARFRFVERSALEGTEARHPG